MHFAILHNATNAVARPSRTGLTLLEVLVASGILVMGLSSLAALLPAAVSLLAQATATDRAGTLAANTPADLQFKGKLLATDFNGGVSTLVIGNALPNPPIGDEPPFKRIDVGPTPVDEQAYGPAWYAAIATPLAAGVPATKGGSARVTVVAFRRANPESKAIELSGTSADGQALPPGVYRLPPEREADRKRFLSPCGWAMAVSGNTIRWLHVGSSWATYLPNGRDVKECFVAFSDPEAATAASTANSLSVHGFAGVVRVEERIVPLD